jgi:hypothetical protein
VLGSILPGGRGQVIRVLMNQLDRYRMKMDQIRDTQGKFNQSVRDAAATPMAKFHTALAQIEASLVKIGANLLPMVVPVVQLLARWIGKAADAFNNLSPSQKKFVVYLLAGMAILGPTVVTVGILVTAIGALISPIGLAVVAIGLFTAALIHAYHHSKLFRTIVNGVWSLMKAAPGALKGAFVAVINWLIGALNKAIDVINDVIKTYNKLPFAPNIGLIGHVGELGGGGGVGGGIAGAPGSHAGTGDLGHGAAGHTVRQTGMYDHGTHGPREALPHGAGKDAVFEIHNHTHLDGKQVAHSVHRQSVKAKANR